MGKHDSERAKSLVNKSESEGEREWSERKGRKCEWRNATLSMNYRVTVASRRSRVTRAKLIGLFIPTAGGRTDGERARVRRVIVLAVDRL